jgi:hypothetical protein
MLGDHLFRRSISASGLARELYQTLEQATQLRLMCRPSVKLGTTLG